MKKIRLTLGLCGVLAVALAVVCWWPSPSPKAAEPSSPVSHRIAAVASQLPMPSKAAAAVAATPLTVRGTKTARITADRTMTAPLRKILEGFGARIIAPMGPRTVLVEVTPAAQKRIVKDVRFKSEDVLPAAKVQSVLADFCAQPTVATVPVTVIGLTAEDRATIAAYVVANGGTLCEGPQVPEVLYAEVPTKLVVSLADRSDVRWLEYNPPKMLLNDRAKVAAAANVENMRTKHRLTGAGQTVGIYDSGFDTGDKDNCHLDFAGRVKAIVNEAYTKADYMGHGTHCAGTILGDGARSDGKYRGAAPDAQLFAQGAGDKQGSKLIYLPGTYEHIFASGLAYDAYVHSDSWGGGSYGVYDATCQGLDEVLWNHPELLVVVAAGNDGNDGMGTVSSPACAKNALTVGNCYSTRSGNPENLNNSSSRGPTKDQRYKPEIAAPGTYIYSTLSSKSVSCKAISSNPYYTDMTGTSMATPLVAGSAALVRQWLEERRAYAEHYPDKRPSSALVKSIITGGGQLMTGQCATNDMPQTVPNYYVGWGRLNMEETLYPTNGRAVKFVDWIPFDDHSEQVIDLETTKEAPLDVQLCWVDYPSDASMDDSQTLINDLDLVVSNKLDGTVWYGNGTVDGDHTNTTESVRVPSAPAGEYAIFVRGHAVSYSSDEGGAAAVYIRGAFESETAPDPLYIRNVRTNERYQFLDDALKEVQSGDRLEVLEPVQLERSVELAVDCTIVATNEDPTVSMITCKTGAEIALASGATLTLSNLVFKACDSNVVTVAAGARMVLAGTVGVGAVAIEDEDAIQFAAPLVLTNSMLLIDAPNGFATGDAFGKFTGDYLSASNAALRVANVRDEDLGGFAFESTGVLAWDVVPVDPAVAGCVLENEDGVVNYRTFARALVDALDKDSTLTIKKDSVVSTPVTLAHNLAIAGDGGMLTFTAQTMGFTIPKDTKLVLTNVMVSGEGVLLKDCAFKVTGGELTLEKGAILSGFGDVHNPPKVAGRDKVWGGAVFVSPGHFTMKSGSQIENCRTYASCGGGAIWACGYEGEAIVDLIGGKITGCWAQKEGGAVYAGWGAQINLQGGFTAVNNTKSENGEVSNLYLTRDVEFSLTGALNGDVGVSFAQSLGANPDLNATNVSFVAIKGELTERAKAIAAACFVNDLDHDLVGDYVEGEIVWALIPDYNGQCDPSEANYAVVIDEGGANEEWRYYEWIEDAFERLDADATVYCIAGDWIGRDIEIRHAVRLASYDVASSGRQTIQRLDDATVRILPGGSLTMEDIQFSGLSKGTDTYPDDYENNSQQGLFVVDGGALTLGSGAVVGPVTGSVSRASNAITVYNGGTLTMLSGSLIRDSQNTFVDQSDATGCGGGILLDHATAYLKGGTIQNCRAARAGAVYVANGSVAYVSGDFSALQDYNLSAEYDCVVVSQNSQLVLDGTLTGRVGVNEGISCDTNWFATVSSDWNWDLDSLTNSAARFIHDKRNTVGQAVTNGVGEAVLVWDDWLSKSGKFIDSTGGIYHICLQPGQSIVVPRAFTVSTVTSANGALVLALDGGVEGCWYTVYSTANLEQPFEKEASIQLKAGEEFAYELDKTADAKFYKVVAEEGLR